MRGLLPRQTPDGLELRLKNKTVSIVKQKVLTIGVLQRKKPVYRISSTTVGESEVLYLGLKGGSVSINNNSIGFSCRDSYYSSGIDQINQTPLYIHLAHSMHREAEGLCETT